MSRPWLWWVLSLVILAATAAAEPSAVAVHRGKLSLAWDAHDSGMFEEALGYLGAIPETSPVADRAAWLRAECYYDQGRYAEAVDALNAPAALELDDRESFLLDLLWDHAWAETSQGRYAEALAVVQRGRTLLPDEPALYGLELATRYRARIVAAATRRAASAPGAGEVTVLPASAAPRGADWVVAHPWSAQGLWVPEIEVAQWWPAVDTLVAAPSDRLWLRVDREALQRALVREAEAAGLRVAVHADGLALLQGDEGIGVQLDEWQFRAAVEGLGAAGAAVFCVLDAQRQLQERTQLLTWVGEHLGDLRQWRDGLMLWLEHPQTGRRFVLEPDSWTELFTDPGQQWEEFWADLGRELARPARAYHCFCGRPSVLREVLVRDSDEPLIVARAGDYAVSLLALCPQHLRFVTPELAQEWGVEVAALARRARQDADAGSWELSFSRGEALGVPYLYLEGDGASSLVRSPELLLGALEAADGYSVRGATVRVHAPTASALVVAAADAPRRATERAAAEVLLQQERYGTAAERLDFEATIHLPPQGRGRFHLTPLE